LSNYSHSLRLPCHERFPVILNVRESTFTKYVHPHHKQPNRVLNAYSRSPALLRKMFWYNTWFLCCRKNSIVGCHLSILYITPTVTMPAKCSVPMAVAFKVVTYECKQFLKEIPQFRCTAQELSCSSQAPVRYSSLCLTFRRRTLSKSQVVPRSKHYTRL